MAVIASTFEGLTGEPETDWGVDAGAFLQASVVRVRIYEGFSISVTMGEVTYSVQCFDIVDAIKFVGHWGLALVDLLDCLVAILLKIGSVGQVPDNPCKGVAKIDPRSD